MAAIWSTVFFLICFGSCARLSAGQVTLDPQEFSMGDSVQMTCSFTKDDSAPKLVLTWDHPSGNNMFEYDSTSSLNTPADEYDLTDYNNIPETSHSMTFKPSNVCDVGEYTCTVVQTNPQTYTADLREFTVTLDGDTLKEDKTVAAASTGTIGCSATGKSNATTLALRVDSDVVDANPPTSTSICSYAYRTSVETGYDLADKQSITVNCTANFDGDEVSKSFTLSVGDVDPTEETTGGTETTTEGPDEMSTRDPNEGGPNSASSLFLSVQLVLFLMAAYLGGVAE